MTCAATATTRAGGYAIQICFLEEGSMLACWTDRGTALDHHTSTHRLHLFPLSYTKTGDTIQDGTLTYSNPSSDRPSTMS
jgi:hypothetical protein